MPPVVTVRISPYKTTHECMGGKYMCSHTDACWLFVLFEFKVTVRKLLQH